MASLLTLLAQCRSPDTPQCGRFPEGHWYNNDMLNGRTIYYILDFSNNKIDLIIPTKFLRVPNYVFCSDTDSQGRLTFTLKLAKEIVSFRRNKTIASLYHENIKKLNILISRLKPNKSEEQNCVENLIKVFNIKSLELMITNRTFDLSISWTKLSQANVKIYFNHWRQLKNSFLEMNEKILQIEQLSQIESFYLNYKTNPNSFYEKFHSNLLQGHFPETMVLMFILSTIVLIGSWVYICWIHGCNQFTRNICEMCPEDSCCYRIYSCCFGKKEECEIESVETETPPYNHSVNYYFNNTRPLNRLPELPGQRAIENAYPEPTVELQD